MWVTNKTFVIQWWNNITHFSNNENEREVKDKIFDVENYDFTLGSRTTNPKWLLKGFVKRKNSLTVGFTNFYSVYEFWFSNHFS